MATAVLGDSVSHCAGARQVSNFVPLPQTPASPGISLKNVPCSLGAARSGPRSIPRLEPLRPERGAKPHPGARCVGTRNSQGETPGPLGITFRRGSHSLAAKEIARAIDAVPRPQRASPWQISCDFFSSPCTISPEGSPTASSTHTLAGPGIHPFIGVTAGVTAGPKRPDDANRALLNKQLKSQWNTQQSLGASCHKPRDVDYTSLRCTPPLPPRLRVLPPPEPPKKMQRNPPPFASNFWKLAWPATEISWIPISNPGIPSH